MNDSTGNGGDRLSVREAALVLDVSRSTIYRWARAGRVSVNRVGRRIFIQRQALERLLARVETQMQIREASEAIARPAGEIPQVIAAINENASRRPEIASDKSTGTTTRGSGQRDLIIPGTPRFPAGFVIFSGFEFLS